MGGVVAVVIIAVCVVVLALVLIRRKNRSYQSKWVTFVILMN